MLQLKLTGVKPLDELIEPAKRDWIIEIYGDEKNVLNIAHHAMVFRSIYNEVYVVLNMEFGGIEVPYLTKLCRIYDCNLDNIYISRAFRLQDTLSILQSLLQAENETIIVIFPYSYVQLNPNSYTEATRITGIISRLSQTNQVILFNTISRFGYKLPEGGSLHHHLVKVIVKITRRNKWIVAELIKHPIKPYGVRTFSEKILASPIPNAEQRTILEWIVSKT
ncbi:MAG: hypothetical protein QW775_03455 [Ignisphaera sp.]|uniref:DNA recombination and repair protein Rad51-like C-terminal domain-containing protein n=1 Tax=Ignisphaera aggregans TaxID=334771 RepID=A0A832FWA6_9CREN